MGNFWIDKPKIASTVEEAGVLVVTFASGRSYKLHEPDDGIVSSCRVYPPNHNPDREPGGLNAVFKEWDVAEIYAVKHFEARGRKLGERYQEFFKSR